MISLAWSLTASLQLVRAADSTNGGEGYVVVQGAWAGLLEHPGRPFSPNYSMMLPGPDRRGHIVDWVGKASFACLNKLFEIAAGERHYGTLLTARNLMAVVRESQEYIINILPRKLPKEGTLCGRLPAERSPPFREAPEKEEAGQKRERSEEPPSSKGICSPPITYEGEVIIEEPVNLAPHSISSGPGQVAGLNHSGPCLSEVARLAILAEEAASINHPGSPHPDADAAEALCATLMEETRRPIRTHRAASRSIARD
ncbi:hypothetical protein AAG906_012101 [Vitis piasezkii]